MQYLDAITKSNRMISVHFQDKQFNITVIQVCLDQFSVYLNPPGWDIDLDYCDIELFALEMNRDYSVVFEIVSKYCNWTLLLTMMATPFLLRDSCPQYYSCI